MDEKMEASPVKAARHLFLNDCSLCLAGDDQFT